jgi:hypothetical protein
MRLFDSTRTLYAPAILRRSLAGRAEIESIRENAFCFSASHSNRAPARRGET